MTTHQIFKQSDNKRIKAMVKYLPIHIDRVYLIVHSQVFNEPIINSKTIQN